MKFMLHYDKVVPSPRGGAVGAGVGEGGWQGLSPPGTVSLSPGAEPGLAPFHPWPCPIPGLVPSLAQEEGKSWVKFYQTQNEGTQQAPCPPTSSHTQGALKWFLKTLDWKEGRAEPDPMATSSHRLCLYRSVLGRARTAHRAL